MNRLFADTDVGKKNIGFGVALFAILGLVIGIPLTVDFLGGSWLSAGQYQTLKVVHGYGVFLSFVNYFFGLSVDRLALTRQQKEIASWSFLLAGVAGGLARLALVLLSNLDAYGIYLSLAETTLFVVGTFIVVRGQLRERASEESLQARYSHVK